MKPSSPFLVSVTALLLAVCAPWLSRMDSAVAQGLLLPGETSHPWRLPRPFHPPHVQPSVPVLYRVKHLEVDARIRDSLARVQMSQTFVNESQQTVEARCVVPLPDDAIVSDVTFMVDGQEIIGKVLSASEANQIYRSYVQRNKDPALVQWIGCGLLQTNVFPIPPGKERTVSIGFSQVLTKSNHLLDWSLPLKGAGYSSQPIEKVSLKVFVEQSTKIGNVYSPTHNVKIDRKDLQNIQVNFEAQHDVPKNDFRLVVSTDPSPMAASWLSYRPSPQSEGYFMLLLHPSLEVAPSPEPKDIVLVLDKSGSMRGEKIEQARQALLYVLEHLPKQDRFGLVVYDSQVNSFQDELSDASDPVTLQAAKSFVNSLTASGGTNIEQGLDTAFKMLGQGDRKSYMVHLSDGRPTVGERDERQITASAVKRNSRRVRMFNFGVGHDVHSRLMNRLSSACFGQTFFVAPDEDIERAVSGLYDRLGQAALSDIHWDIVPSRPDQACKVTMTYPTKLDDLFVGNQVSLVGKFTGSGKAKLVVTGKLNGEQKHYDHEIDLDSASSRQDSAYIASIWASRRAAGIVDEIDLEGNKESLVRELIELAKKYGILTEYTAFLAEEPSGVTPMVRERELLSRLDRLQADAGADAFGQRSSNLSAKSVENLAQSESAQGRSFRMRGAGGGGMGGSQGLGGMPSGGAYGGQSERRFRTSNDLSDHPKSNRLEELEKKADSAEPMPIQRAGDRAFFLQNGQWVDSKFGESLPPAPKKVERFSDEYFRLVEKHRDILQSLIELEEPILVELDGVAYQL